MTRIRLRTTRASLPNGTVVVRKQIIAAPELEWRLQAAAVRRLRGMAGYGDRFGPGVTFTIAGDFNAARRSPQESVKAKATGLTPGEEDLRVYMRGARLGLIEFKAERGRLSPEQKVRHELHRGLGFEVEVVKAKTEDEAADAVESLVRRWLAQPANGYEVGVRHGRTLGYYAAANDVLGLINTIEERVVAKKDMYASVSALRPPANDNSEGMAA